MSKKRKSGTPPKRKDGQVDKRYGPKVRPPAKPAERAAFAAWLSTPPTLRNPKTQAQLSEVLGVNDGTLSDWKRAPDIRGMVREHADAMTERVLPEVWGALVEKCREGGVVGLEAIRLALTSLGRLSPLAAPTAVERGGSLADEQAALLRAMNLTPVDPSYRPGLSLQVDGPPEPKGNA